MLITAILVIISMVFQNVSLNVRADGDYSLSGDEELTADVVEGLLAGGELGRDSIHTNGYTLTINGDVNITKPLFIGEGGQVIVNGDLYTSDVVTIEKEGKLKVNGDFTHKNADFGYLGVDAVVEIDGDFTFGNTGLASNVDDSAVVNVSGNLVFDSTVGMLAGGTWRVKGDVLQKRADGGEVILNKLIMTGEGDKSLTLQSNGRIGKLYLENGFTLDVPLNFYCEEVNTDITIKTGENTIFTAIGIPDERKIVIDGNMTVSSPEFHLGKRANLKIKGSFMQKDGEIGYISEDASFDVEGDMTFGSTGSAANVHDSVNVSVSGNLVFDSTVGMLVGGTWRVKGNVLQKRADGGEVYLDKLVMTGDGDKSFTFRNNGRIGKLYLENGLTLDVPLNFNCEEVNTDITIKTGENTIFTAIGIPDERKIVIDGNMTVSSQDFHLGKKAGLKVKGSFMLKDGEIGYISEDALFDVEGDMTFGSTGSAANVHDSVIVSVSGNLVFDSTVGTSTGGTWRVKGNALQKRSEGGEVRLNKLVMETADAKVEIKKGVINTLILAYGKSHFTIDPDNCYEKLIATSVVSLNACGGSVDPSATTATTEEKYGELPVPVLEGKDFAGWYTEIEGGTEVTAATIVTAVDDHVLYAHWTDASEERAVLSANMAGKINDAEVIISINGAYPQAVTWTGKKIVKGQLTVLSEDGVIAIVNVTGLDKAISGFKPDADLSKLIVANIVIGKEKNANSKGSFYLKLSINAKAAKNAGIKGKDKKALNAIVKEFNKELKANPYSFDIVPIELKDAASISIKAKLKKGELVLNDDGSIKGLKSVKIKVQVPGTAKVKTYSFSAKKALKSFKITVTDKDAKKVTIEALSGQSFSGSVADITVTK